MICVLDFPREEVSVKVGVMEFGLRWLGAVNSRSSLQVDGKHDRHCVERLLVIDVRRLRTAVRDTVPQTPAGDHHASPLQPTRMRPS